MSPLCLVFLLVGTTLCAPVPGKESNKSGSKMVVRYVNAANAGDESGYHYDNNNYVTSGNANNGRKGPGGKAKDRNRIQEQSDSYQEDNSDDAVNDGEKQEEDYGDAANGASDVGGAVKSVIKGKLDAAKDGGNAVGDVSKGDVGGAEKETKGAVSDMVEGDKGAVGALLGGEQKASGEDGSGAGTGAANEVETGAENEAGTGTENEVASGAEKEVADVNIHGDIL